MSARSARTLPHTLAACAAALALAACAAAPRSTPADAAGLRVEERTTLRGVFAEADVGGVFALRRVDGPEVVVSDAARARRPYLPASTFKIPNSLIALELGIVADEHARFPMTWEPTEIEAWNREHTFASALRASVVPVYQIVARQVGEARYREWLERMDYGNRDPGGGIEHFWLDGDLRTSALDQVDFLSRMAAGSLPVSERSRRIVRGMLAQEETACYRLFAKTGLVGVAARREVAPEERVGWYVGWVESDTATWAFALNLDVSRPGDAGKRAPLARELLARAGVLPADGCGR
jgi:beta-lactamase class D